MDKLSIDKCLSCTKPECDGCEMDKQPEPKRSESAQQRARERCLARYYANRDEILAKRKEKYHNNAVYRESVKARYREKYQNDPEYRERMKQKAIERKKECKK